MALIVKVMTTRFMLLGATARSLVAEKDTVSVFKLVPYVARSAIAAIAVIMKISIRPKKGPAAKAKPVKALVLKAG
jgi:hypothetical protein